MLIPLDLFLIYVIGVARSRALLKVEKTIIQNYLWAINAKHDQALYIFQQKH